MINFELVANKIERVLNGNDVEVASIVPNTPTDLLFHCETLGFHLDHIYDKEKGKNFIPVFLSSMGGNLNPVPELKQGNYSLPITFYFPVRFKNLMYKVYDYLEDVFCGRVLNYALDKEIPVYDSAKTYSAGAIVQRGGKVYECKTNNTTGNWDATKWVEIGKCVSNISIPTYGEIQNADLKEFDNWATQRFHDIIEVNQPYMMMSLNLYLSNANKGFVYGNEVELAMKIEDITPEIAEEKITFVGSALQGISQSLSEQELGQSEAEGLPTTTATGVSFNAYYKDNAFFNKIVDAWFSGDTQSLRITAKLKLGSYTYQRYAYVESLNMPIRKGELLSITFTLAKAIDDRTPSEE